MAIIFDNFEITCIIVFLFFYHAYFMYICVCIFKFLMFFAVFAYVSIKDLHPNIFQHVEARIIFY